MSPAIHLERPRRRQRTARQRGVREPGARFWVASEAAESRASVDGRILIVDDESAIRLICRLNLESVGFETLEAPDGETALALSRVEQPDLIVLDIMLPGIDGWGVAEELADAPETRDIPILFLSARSDRSDETRGLEAGGLGHVTKPFDPDDLTARVHDVLQRTRRGEREALRSEWKQRLRSP